MNDIRFLRRGSGTPLLLVHGLGGSAESWCPILNSLAHEREVIAIDMPGFGESPPLEKSVTIGNLADAVSGFLNEQNLTGIDAVGISAGARVVLELTRRGGSVGATIAISPSGFCRGFVRHSFFASNFATVQIARGLGSVLSDVVSSKAARSAILAQLSHHPSRVPEQIVLTELRSILKSRSFEALLRELAYGEGPRGAKFGEIESPLVIAWGKQDRLCFSNEAQRALETFPDAKLRWFKDCGHYPQWDAPEELVHLILENTGLATRALRRRPTMAVEVAVALNGLARTAAHVQSAPIDSPAL